MSDDALQADPWDALRRHTPARIALGRAGSSLPTAEWLRFAAAHAEARDAVQLPLDVDRLQGDLLADGWPEPVRVQSRADSRATYLRRPDLGRRLNATSAAHLSGEPVDLAIVLGDGLSAAALQSHATPLLHSLRQALDGTLSLAPPVIAKQARVALGDEIGALLRARVVLVLIGERPGLSSPDSLGAYLTHAPALGRSDAERNCVSNIRPQGLTLDHAAARIAWLLHESLRRRLSGIALKDDSTVLTIAPADVSDRAR